MAIVAAFGSCDAEEPCASTISNRFRMDFLAPGPEDEIVGQPFFFDSVKAIGALRPIWPEEGYIGTNTLSLSLNPDADTTTYVFYYQGDQQDTMRFTYKRGSRMISTDCDLEINFTDVVLLDTLFAENDSLSVELITTEISDNVRGPNLQVLRTANCTPVETNRLRLGFFTLNEGGEEVAETRNFKKVSRSGSNDIYFPITMGQTGVETLDIKLNPDANESTFIFEHQTRDPDTLVLSYKRRAPIVSVYCIPDIHFYEIRVEENSTTFEHVQVLTPAITGPTQEINVKIINK